MSVLTFLIPMTLIMGVVALAVFFWSLRSGQYEDLTGDAERILFDSADEPLEQQNHETPRAPERPEDTRTKETTS